MSILDKKATVKPLVAEGNYELPLISIEEHANDKGGYVQLTFALEGIEIIHNIFGANQKQIDYTVQTLARQLDKTGELSLSDVLVEGFVYKLFVSYNRFGRNVAFGVKQTFEEETEELDLTV